MLRTLWFCGMTSDIFRPSSLRTPCRYRWYTNDDFNINYEEEYKDGETWKCRWDRHPNSHNRREHFHPPPDASTSGEELSYAKDWRDVISLVLNELDNHIQGFWRD
jgi:hypothetical protein